ncbi:MAG: hypothetical protein SF187_05875 [Deltaproteobacteria bacterium]|nr:hypothetical protein [Deltaproteobacteria bacterium]
MRTSLLLASVSVIGLAWAVSCGGGNSEGDNEGGMGGEVAGAGGGTSEGGKAGSSAGGKGGSGSGGKGGSPGTGGTNATGGSTGTGGANTTGGSTGTGGAANTGGTPGTGGMVTCATLPGQKLIEFESDADLFMTSSAISNPANLRVPAPMPQLVTSPVHTKAKAMELVINTADGMPSGGSDAGADAGAGGTLRYQWFFIVKDRSMFMNYLQAGRTISAWVLVPAGNQLKQLSLVLQTVNGWKSQSILAAATPGQWTKIDFLIPQDYDCSKVTSNNLFELGIYGEVTPGTTWSGKIYVDDFSISAK